jgi:hypothetical protein
MAKDGKSGEGGVMAGRNSEIISQLIRQRKRSVNGNENESWRKTINMAAAKAKSVAKDLVSIIKQEHGAKKPLSGEIM